MDWKEIMAIEEPHKALLRIEEKVWKEGLSVSEMEERVLAYMKTHGAEMEEMAYYPNGDSVIGNRPPWK